MLYQGNELQRSLVIANDTSQVTICMSGLDQWNAYSLEIDSC